MARTEDGWELGVFRIKNSAVMRGERRRVVFLQHGLFDASNCWVSNDPPLAPAYLLASAGYDVWLGNNRGNLHSQNNININPSVNPEQYSDYSFTKLGQYDLPA